MIRVFGELGFGETGLGEMGHNCCKLMPQNINNSVIGIPSHSTQVH